METIVVPLDDSPDARRALRPAFSVARRGGAQVVLVSSCPPERAGEVAESLHEAGERFRALAPFSVEVVDGPPAEAVLECTPPGEALICMSTHARRAVSRLVLGSVAEDVVRRSTRPILCVGPAATEVFLPEEHVDGLVCTDDSSASDIVVDHAASFAAGIRATCSVIQVVGPDEDVALDGGPTPRPLREQAERHSSELAERLAARGVGASHVVLPGDPAGAIVQHAQTRWAGFVVVGTSGRTGLDRVTLGSVATGVVRHAPCPVLVVPTHDRRQHHR